MRFRIIPVIDLKGGIAVHARGGDRAQYRPLQSVWQAGPSPVRLAAALLDGLGCDTLYVADLDAIESGRGSNFALRDLRERPVDLWLDAGIRNVASLAPLGSLAAQDPRVVIGLETIEGPSALRAVVEQLGADRVVFSLDLRDGVPQLAPAAHWADERPEAIVAQVTDLGIRRIIILDLAHVGSGRGTGTVRLLERLIARWPATAFIVGGGIRGVDDLLALREMGASGVLVGSALHDGRIGRRELERVIMTGLGGS